MADLRLVPSLGTGLKQRSQAEIQTFQKFLLATNAELAGLLQQRLAMNCLVEEVRDPANNLVSLDSNEDPDFDVDLDTYNTRAEEDLGYKMEGDGPMWNEIPDDRKAYLSTVEGMTEYLTQQVSAMNLSDEDNKIAIFLINSLNENGFIQDYQDVSQYISISSEVTQTQIDSVYNTLINKLEPAGILTNGPQESLLAQLKRYDSNPQVETAKILVGRFFQDLSKKDLSGLARALNQTNTYGVANAFRLIEELNAHPFQARSQSTGRSSIPKEPDLIARNVTAGEYLRQLRNEYGYSVQEIAEKIGVSKSDIKAIEKNEIRLSQQGLNDLGKAYKISTDILVEAIESNKTFFVATPNTKTRPIIVKVDRSPLDIEISSANGKKVNTEAEKYVKEAQREIKTYNDILDDRYNMLGRIVTYAVNTQRDYIQSGNKTDLVPLLVKEIAENFKVSDSTVSSVFSEKYIQLENNEILRLKDLLDSGRVNELGERISKSKVNNYIKEAIEAKYLISDTEISANIKKEFQVNVSTQFISKSRESLNIPSEAERKHLSIKPQVESAINAVISREEKKNPVTDQILTIKLKEIGIDLTVHQLRRYREEMNVGSSLHRKDQFLKNETVKFLTDYIQTESKQRPLNDREIANKISEKLEVRVDSQIVAESRVLLRIPEASKRVDNIKSQVEGILKAKNLTPVSGAQVFQPNETEVLVKNEMNK